MPNLIFIGFTEEIADRVIEKLVEAVPVYMEDAVYKAYPNDAPRHAITRRYAPYIIVRGTDIEQALEIKEQLMKMDIGLNGCPDIEIDIIPCFFQGTLSPLSIAAIMKI